MKYTPKYLFALTTTTILALLTPQYVQALEFMDWSTPASLNSNADFDIGHDRNPQLANDGNETWIVVWESFDTLGDSIGSDPDILYAVKSIDNEVWSKPAPLNSNATLDLVRDIDPEITTDGNGNWMVIWNSVDPVSNSGVIVYSIYNAELNTWSAQSVMALGGWQTQLTTDGKGNWIAVWSSADTLNDTIGSDTDILYSTYNFENDIWSTPSPLNSNAEVDDWHDRHPQLTTDGSGNWVAVWNSMDNRNNTIGTDIDILYSIYDIKNDTWSPALPMNTDPNVDSDLFSKQDYLPQLTTDGNGNWIGTWTSFRFTRLWNRKTDFQTNYAIYDIKNNKWSLPSELGNYPNSNVSTRTDVWSQLTTDGKKNWVALWGYNDTVYSVYDLENDTWSEPIPLNGYNEVEYGTQLTTDGHGNWITVWAAQDSWSDSYTRDLDIKFSKGIFSTLGNDKEYVKLYPVEPPALLNTNATSDTVEDESPQIATDGEGTWIAVWASPEEAGWAKDIIYSVRTVGSTTWSSPKTLYSSFGIGDDEPQITTDNQGNWIVVWQSGHLPGSTDGWDGDILYSSYDLANDTWSTPALLNSNAETDSGLDAAPQITTDGDGNWIAVWSSSDTLDGTIESDFDIFYALYDIENNTWSPPELLNYTTRNSQLNTDFRPKLTTDGKTWIAIWESINGTQRLITKLYSIYDLENDTWSISEPLHSYADSTYDVSIKTDLATDGLGRWIAVFESQVGFYSDFTGISYTSYDVENNTWSPPKPININTSTDFLTDLNPQLTTDSHGNWIATWQSEDHQLDTIGADQDILYSVYNTKRDKWSIPAPLNSNAYTDIGNDINPQIVTDQQGNWLVVWVSDDSQSDTTGTDTDILYTRFFVSIEDGSGSDTPCFIATAAYGTPLAREINTLRTFRDTRLLTNPLGAAFTDTYYRLSPPIAQHISQHPAIATLTRAILTPLIILLTLNPFTTLLITLPLTILLLKIIQKRHRHQLDQIQSNIQKS